MLRSIALVLLMTAAAHGEGARDRTGLVEGNGGTGGDAAHVGGKAPPRETPEAERKARAEMEARDKRWDANMRKAMSGVCRGC